jgi:hypothetical protein
MECGIKNNLKGSLKAGAVFFLLALSACSGLGGAGGLPEGGGVNAATGETPSPTEAQPFPGQRPSPNNDPTCKEGADCLSNGLLIINEEKRTYTRLADGELKTEISAHFIVNESQGPIPFSSQRLLLVKETVSQLCIVTQVGEGGRVEYQSVTPTQVMPGFRYFLSKEGYEHAKGNFKCSDLEDGLDTGVHVVDSIKWDTCFAPLVEGGPLDLMTPVDTPWVADYCPARRSVPSGNSVQALPVNLSGLSNSSAALQIHRIVRILSTSGSPEDDAIQNSEAQPDTSSQ